MAITIALMTLGFYEMPESDQPPEEIWHHGERLEEWFKAVKYRQEHPNMEVIEDEVETIDDGTTIKNELMDELNLGR